MHHPGVAGIDLAQLRLEELFGLDRREAQVPQVQLEYQFLAAQPRQGQRHGTARHQRQVQVGRGVVDQPLQGLVNAHVGQVVEVVEYQHQFTATAGNAAHQGDDGALNGFAVDAATFQLSRVPHQRRVDLAEACQQVVKNTRQFVVVRRQRQPRHVEPQRQQRLAPGDQGRGLAAAGRPLEHDAAQASGLEHLILQAFAGNQAPGAARRNQFGADDRGLNRIEDLAGMGVRCIGLAVFIHGAVRFFLVLWVRRISSSVTQGMGGMTLSLAATTRCGWWSSINGLVYWKAQE
ncbi:hypothetical protein D3C86_875400 [compost metagenome]